MKPIVHLVDDDESYVRSLARLLEAAGFTTRTYTSAAAFLARPGADGAGCVVTDLQMPDVSGIDLQGRVAASANPLPVLFVTGRGDIPTSVRAMRGGAEDFLTKRAPMEEVLAAVSRALERDAREREQRARQAAVRRRFGVLSQRELDVLGGVVRGMLNKQIAADLGIAERTVKFHRTALTRKLGVSSVAEITLLAREAGLTSVDCAGTEMTRGPAAADSPGLPAE